MLEGSASSLYESAKDLELAQDLEVYHHKNTRGHLFKDLGFVDAVTSLDNANKGFFKSSKEYEGILKDMRALSEDAKKSNFEAKAKPHVEKIQANRAERKKAKDEANNANANDNVVNAPQK